MVWAQTRRWLARASRARLSSQSCPISPSSSAPTSAPPFPRAPGAREPSARAAAPAPPRERLVTARRVQGVNELGEVSGGRALLPFVPLPECFTLQKLSAQDLHPCFSSGAAPGAPPPAHQNAASCPPAAAAAAPASPAQQHPPHAAAPAPPQLPAGRADAPLPPAVDGWARPPPAAAPPAAPPSAGAAGGSYNNLMASLALGAGEARLPEPGSLPLEGAPLPQAPVASGQRPASTASVDGWQQGPAPYAQTVSGSYTNRMAAAGSPSVGAAPRSDVPPVPPPASALPPGVGAIALPEGWEERRTDDGKASIPPPARAARRRAG